MTGIDGKGCDKWRCMAFGLHTVMYFLACEPQISECAGEVLILIADIVRLFQGASILMYCL